MKDQGHLEDTMAHEMVHAFDHLRFKVNWTDNLRHAACTEVCFHNFLDHSDFWLTCLDSGKFAQRRV